MHVALLSTGVVAFFASALVTSRGLLVVPPSGVEHGATRPFLSTLTEVSDRALGGLWLVAVSVGAEIVGSAWPQGY
ncbi:MAG TPA: hypothetical protein VL966_18155 [Alphaproteobacteria bacterium]|jgi:hypothetical protein|nr:hypothetical protein [Alphaproteobacteria bacterium]